MKYRHAFHAGNFGDLLKHAALVWLLDALGRKEKPYFFLDTHAGRGRYSLASQPALKSGEAREGILKLLSARIRSEALRRYLEVVRAFNPGTSADRLDIYPGSGLIAQRLLRAIDRAVLCEIQAHEAEALSAAVGRDARFHVECRDGYAALKALLPPAERRGLVLVDPVYEEQQESSSVATALGEALKRWRTGVYCLWYPIKLRTHVEQLERTVLALAPPPTLSVELCVYRDDSRAALNGAGILIVNPPWHAEEALREAVTELHGVLAHDALSPRGVRWLVRE
jgi:23S rRNA (adenine2030-N6)-methyltransferase